MIFSLTDFFVFPIQICSWIIGIYGKIVNVLLAVDTIIKAILRNINNEYWVKVNEPFFNEEISQIN